MTPSKIGHYTIVSELGRGGMGVVYKAHEESLNRFVAIKVLGEHLCTDPTFVARFVREAQAAAALSHPNIIQIFFIGEDEGRHFFVMEYVSGKSLLAMVREEGRIDNPRAAQFMLQAANGLAVAHDKGFLHRDIKPANLMVDERGLLKIADFGLALPQDAATRLTATGMLMGTPGYLSPEQCRGEAVDRRTDIYSLGVTFFELLSGHTPFHADSPLALLRKILEEEPPDIASLSDAVDPETRRIVHRMIAKDPAQRYQDCHELAADLERQLDAAGARPASGGIAGMRGAAAGAAAVEGAGGDERTTRLPGPGGATGAAPTAVSAPESGAAVAAPPPPVTVPAAEAVAALVPAPQAMPVPAASASPSVRSSRAPVLVALGVVALLLIAMGVSAFFALRSPLVRKYVPWLSAARVSRSATGAPEAPPPGSGEPAAAAAAADQVAAGTSDDVAASGAAPVSAAGGAGAVETAPAFAPGTARGNRADGAPAAGKRPFGGAAREGQAGRRAGPPAAARAASGREEPGRAVVAGRVAVAVVGDQPLAGVVASLVQSDLSSAGLQPVDAASLPGAEELLRGRGAPGSGELVRAVGTSDAAALVVVRIEPAGERTLSYMGRR
ncbi:MAG TPA: protein kinase, partial [Thermoanaerobaculaceae bacterium]|nr:protein kinase [Thermoanaerobaculaceae bacterium]